MSIKLSGGDLRKLTTCEIMDKRQSLLKASLSERQTIAWRVKWEELHELEKELGQLKSKEKININQKIYPWGNRCSNSLILVWRDHLYKDIQVDSTVLELGNEFNLSQDLFRRRIIRRPGLLVKLKAWVERKMKLQSTNLQRGEVEESEDSGDDGASLGEGEGEEEEAEEGEEAEDDEVLLPAKEDGVPETQAHMVSVVQSVRLSHLQVCVMGAQAAVASAENQMEKAYAEYIAKMAGMEKAMARCDAEVKLADQCRGSIASTALRVRSTAERKRHAKDKKEGEERWEPFQVRHQEAREFAIQRYEAACAEYSAEENVRRQAVEEAAARAAVTERKQEKLKLRKEAKVRARGRQAEVERLRSELAVRASQEVREKEYEERVTVALRRAERVEARRQSAAAWWQSLALRRGGIRRGKRRQMTQCSSSYVVSGVHVELVDAIPTSVFFDVVSPCFIWMFLSCFIRRPCCESITSSTASPVLLVSALCIYTCKLLVWRGGACHIDSMCRLGYG